MLYAVVEKEWSPITINDHTFNDFASIKNLRLCPPPPPPPTTDLKRGVSASNTVTPRPTIRIVYQSINQKLGVDLFKLIQALSLPECPSSPRP